MLCYASSSVDEPVFLNFLKIVFYFNNNYIYIDRERVERSVVYIYIDRERVERSVAIHYGRKLLQTQGEVSY